MAGQMKVVELPEDWSPSVDLETVGFLRGTLDSVAAATGLAIHEGQDDFALYKAIHLIVDDQTPIVLIQYDNAPNETYVMTLPRCVDPTSLIISVMTSLGVERDQIHWQRGPLNSPPD
jgi:hypothetical protein